MFILIKCLCMSCGYELLVTICRGHELHVNRKFTVGVGNDFPKPVVAFTGDSQFVR